MAHDVFISYSTQDRELAEHVCRGLEERSVKCWIAPRNILPGVDYGKALVSAIARARVFLLILSKASNRSSHVLKETERAVSHGTPVVPLRIEAVDLSSSMEYYLSNVQWLDAPPPVEPATMDRLEQIIRHLLEDKDSIRLSNPVARQAAATGESTSIEPDNLPVDRPAGADWGCIIGAALLILLTLALAAVILVIIALASGILGI